LKKKRPSLLLQNDRTPREVRTDEEAGGAKGHERQGRDWLPDSSMGFLL